MILQEFMGLLQKNVSEFKEFWEDTTKGITCPNEMEEEEWFDQFIVFLERTWK